MASGSSAVPEEQLRCSICLEVFSAPVTTSCGHSFCRTCINQHWDSNSDIINCPVCKQDFSSRPQLKPNIILAEMVFELKNKSHNYDDVSEKTMVEPQSASEEMACGDVEPLEVLCDLCPEPKLEAVKSCLVCMASYCQEHLQPHLNNPRLKRHHQLIEPLSNLEERICPEHNRTLELFCSNHSQFICLECTSGEHKYDDAVPLKEEGEAQQTTLKEQIEQRFVKIEEIKHSVELSQKNADTEIQEGVKVFNILMECVQQSLDSFKQSIEEKHRKTEEEAAQIIEQIQMEISALERRAAEMKQLWSTGDHLKFVETFTSAKPAPELKNWENKNICATYGVMLSDAVTKWKDQVSEETEKFFKADLKRFQKCEVNVTLDVNTANQYIQVSCKSKEARYLSKQQNYPANSKRFSYSEFVLGKQSFSSGQFYFEVSVYGSKQWTVGVAHETVARTEYKPLPSNGYWLIEGNPEQKQFKVGGLSIARRLECMPDTVGVFVDYELGLVSFFDVKAAILIKSLKNCVFTGKVLPLISPGSSGWVEIRSVQNSGGFWSK